MVSNSFLIVIGGLHHYVSNIVYCRCIFQNLVNSTISIINVLMGLLVYVGVQQFENNVTLRISNFSNFKIDSK